MIWWSELWNFLLGEVSFRKLPDITDSDNVQVDLFPVDLPKSTNQSHLPNSIFRIPDFWVTSNPKFRLLDSDEILFDCRLLMKFHLFWSQNRTKNLWKFKKIFEFWGEISNSMIKKIRQIDVRSALLS